MSDSSVEDRLPLKPVVLQILLALAERESHGYGAILAVRERSDGRISLETGPFYRYLRKLMDEALVEESPHRPEDDDARRGAYYRITDLGRQVVAAETERLVGVVSLSEQIGVRGGGRS